MVKIFLFNIDIGDISVDTVGKVMCFQHIVQLWFETNVASFSKGSEKATPTGIIYRNVSLHRRLVCVSQSLSFCVHVLEGFLL